MTDKIILFLVEGPTDEDTLALIYSKIVKDHDIKFEVLHTDITADEEMTVKYIEVRIKKAVGGFQKQLELKKFKLFFLCIMHKEEGEENDKPRVVQSKQKEIM
ncbi:hypothetical protein [Mediterraneibacter gnavus]|uniref:hypothetical protein n=1 Tax=Mediterraneibacter gnavus TaxID=33038 RepID=UPI0022E639CB|nr:hypothetical protein [Mediterraneibacter gnavus]